MASNTSNTLSLQLIIEKDKLNGLNLVDWYLHLNSPQTRTKTINS